MLVLPDDDDPIIAEVRRNRREYFASFGNDMDLIRQDLKRSAEKWPNKRVSFVDEGPKRANPTRQR